MPNGDPKSSHSQRLIHQRSEANQDLGELLAEAVRRAPLLTVLLEGPARPNELTDRVDSSRSTIHRATDALESHNLIYQTMNGAYALTNVGEYVAQATVGYQEQVRTAQLLEAFLNEVENGEPVPVGHFSEARITERTPREPHIVIQRLDTLLTQSEHLQMLSTVLSPIHVEIGYREIMSGTTVEAIFDPHCIDLMLEKHIEKARETINTGRFSVFMHDDLPFEVFILDDRVGMAVHSPDGGAEVLVESEQDPAINWAQTLFDRKLHDADPLILPE